MPFADDEKDQDGDNREDQGKQEGRTKIAVKPFRNFSGDGRPGQTADIPAEGQERVGGHADMGHAPGGLTVGPRPQNADGHAAERTAGQRKDRRGGKGGQQVRKDTEQAGAEHESLQSDLFAELAVEDTGYAHEDSEHARPQQVPQRFINTQRRFCKGGGPLAHDLFCGPRADHEREEQQEQLAFLFGGNGLRLL